MSRRLLILGGSAEALALAGQAVALDGLHVVTSLAGRTRRPVAPAGETRTGGFGGAEGLARYLREAEIDLVIDATHPFAAVISGNAARACEATGVPRLALVRPEWTRRAGDEWIEVADVEAAAAALPAAGRRVFLALGGKHLAPFAGVESAWFLVRAIEPPAAARLLENCTVIAARGPFTLEDETALLGRHRIDAVVSRNSGGEGAYAKIAAARALGLPVLMIRRPPPPPDPRAANVEDAIAWLRARLG